MTPSPFPGMDPYLEAHWLDVHGSVIHLAKAALQPQLEDNLVAHSKSASSSDMRAATPD